MAKRRLPSFPKKSARDQAIGKAVLVAATNGESAGLLCFSRCHREGNETGPQQRQNPSMQQAINQCVGPGKEAGLHRVSLSLVLTPQIANGALGLPWLAAQATAQSRKRLFPTAAMKL
jgi:hypothetical protein